MDRIRRHEADIVPVQRVFGAGIAKADDEEHGAPSLRTRRNPGAASASGLGGAAAASSACSSVVRAAGGTMVASVRSSDEVGLTPSGRADRRDMHGVADIEAGQVDDDVIRDGIGRAGHVELVRNDVEHAAQLAGPAPCPR